MPSPVGHALAGYAIAQTSRSTAYSRRILLYTMLLACAADVDMFFGYFPGEPLMFRHRATHSLVAAFAVSLACAWFYGTTRRPAGRAFTFAFAVYASHLLLDMLR